MKEAEMYSPFEEVEIVGYDFGWAAVTYEYDVCKAQLKDAFKCIMEYESKGELIPDYYVVYDGKAAKKRRPEGYMFSIDTEMNIEIMKTYKNQLTVDYLKKMFAK